MAVDQYYVFEHDGWAWCEMFYTDRTGFHHVTAPTPHVIVDRAVSTLKALYPSALVDTLCDPSDMVDALRFQL
jgi:hypothetical protein